LAKAGDGTAVAIPVAAATAVAAGEVAVAVARAVAAIPVVAEVVAVAVARAVAAVAAGGGPAVAVDDCRMAMPNRRADEGCSLPSSLRCERGYLVIGAVER
jgi:hypothetical protein